MNADIEGIAGVIKILEGLVKRSAAIWTWERAAIQVAIEALRVKEYEIVARYSCDSEGNVSTTYAEPKEEQPAKEIGHILIKKHKIYDKGGKE